MNSLQCVGQDATKKSISFTRPTLPALDLGQLKSGDHRPGGTSFGSYPSDSNLIGTIPKLRGSFAIGWRLIMLQLEQLEDLKCLLSKVGIWCSFDSESFAWNVQPVLNNVKLDEEERNAQLEECHDAKASMCLGIRGRMQSSTYSMLFRFTHAPFSRHLHAFSVLRR